MQNFDFTNLPGQSLHKRFVCEDIKPLVSIITPFYNAGNYIEQTFNSVINQSFPYFEWIIVDDDSTNIQDSKALDALAATDSRITVHHRINELRRTTGRSYGASASRNYGASVANTEYLLFLDADDLIDPVFVETMYLALRLEPEAAWAYTDIVNFGDKDLLWRREYSSDLMKIENLQAPDAMVRKSMFDDLGGFATMEGRFFNEDWHFWLCALAKGYRPVHVAQYLFWYRNLSSGVLGTLKNNEEEMRVNNEIIAKAAAQVPDGIKAIEYIGATKKEEFTGIKKWHEHGIYIEPFPYAKKKKQILFVFPHLFMGGSDNFNLEFIKRLDREVYEITIVTTLPEDNEWQHLFTPYADDIFALPFLFDMSQWASFLDYLIRTRDICTVFCSNSYYGYFSMPWLQMQHPSVAMVDYVHMEEWYYRGGGYARTAGNVGGIVAKTFVCNQNTRNVIINNFKRTPETVQTVYIGVDEQKYNPENCDTSIVFESLPNIDKEKPIVLFPCRIVAQKRPFLMLEIAKQMPNLNFVVVGDGLQEGELKAAVANQNVANVFFAGRIDDMRPWYKAAHATLICSLREGLSLTAYESLSMATPVVTSNTGGQAELVHKHVGAVIPLDYEKTLQEDNRNFTDEIHLYVTALNKILSDVNSEEYKAMCQNCREHIVENFTLDKMAQTLTAEIEQLLCEDAIEARIKNVLAYGALTPLFESYAELFADYDYLERKFFFSDGSYRYFKDYFDKEGYPAAQELARLKQTRSYRVAMAYQHTVQNSKLLQTVRNLLGKIKSALRK